MSSRALTGCASASILAGLPHAAYASDFQILVVFFVGIGISGILIVQALIGIIFVVNQRYVTRQPNLFASFGAALVFIGVVVVSSEARHLSAGDLTGMLATILVPGAIAIIPPLVQHAWGKSGKRM